MDDSKVVLCGNEIEINKVYAYTYPSTIPTDDFQKIVGWITSATMFHAWLQDEDTPEKFKGDPDIWKKYIQFLRDVAKSGPVSASDIVNGSMGYSRTGTAHIDLYPWDEVEVFDYFSTVFFYTVKVNLESVGLEIVNQGGKLLKRIKNALYKGYQVSLPDIFWEFLGGIVKGFACEPEKTVYWRITDNLLWTDGSFSDSGSCVMSRDGSYRDGLRMLITSGAYAVQVFSAEVPKYRRNNDRKEYTNGIGRAFLVVRNPDEFFVFNGYGNDVLSPYGSTSKCTDKIADILSAHIGVKRQCVYLDIMPEKVIYANDDGKCQYFGKQKVDRVSHHFSIDYDTYIDDDEDDRVACCSCGRRIDESDAYECGGDWFCERCFNDQFFYCFRCSTYHSVDYSVDTEDGTVCEDCVNDLYTQCENCGVYRHNDRVNLVNVADGESEHFCSRCCETLSVSECADCCELFVSALIETVGSDTYCSACAEAHTTQED